MHVIRTIFKKEYMKKLFLLPLVYFATISPSEKSPRKSSKSPGKFRISSNEESKSYLATAFSRERSSSVDATEKKHKKDPSLVSSLNLSPRKLHGQTETSEDKSSAVRLKSLDQRNEQKSREVTKVQSIDHEELRILNKAVTIQKEDCEKSQRYKTLFVNTFPEVLFMKQHGNYTTSMKIKIDELAELIRWMNEKECTDQYQRTIDQKIIAAKEKIMRFMPEK